MSQQCLLLVEGVNDKSFFEAFCKMLQLDADVRVAPPRELGGNERFNSKQGAINYLPLLLKRLATGGIERIGLVLDADQQVNGSGFARTVAQVEAVLAPAGFITPPLGLPNGGLVFRHGNGLADLGLWVMPDNAADGILEDWISQTVPASGSAAALLAHAQKIVASLPHDLKITPIKPSRIRKAEVATWMAWQERPGEGLYYAVEGNLLDQEAALYLALSAWMRHIFL